MNEKQTNDMWLIDIPILSVSCPYSGRMMSSTFPIISELVKDKCHNPNNPKWLLWTYPECDKESCPIKTKEYKL